MTHASQSKSINNNIGRRKNDKNTDAKYPVENTWKLLLMVLSIWRQKSKWEAKKLIAYNGWFMVGSLLAIRAVTFAVVADILHKWSEVLYSQPFLKAIDRIASKSSFI